MPFVWRTGVTHQGGPWHHRVYPTYTPHTTSDPTHKSPAVASLGDAIFL
jgi:hypothetical protein